MGWGSGRSRATVVFSRPVPPTVEDLSRPIVVDADAEEYRHGTPSEEDQEYVDPFTRGEIYVRDLLSHFPILRDMLDEVRWSCRCHRCQGSKAIQRLKPGCVQHTAWVEVMAYVAHAVADAFGAEDCSSRASREVHDFGAVQTFRELPKGSIFWDTWFEIASRVVLGCSDFSEMTSDDSVTDYSIKGPFMDSDLSSTTTVAVQHGNLAVLAPWLDLTKQLRLRGSFAFEVVEGRLGLLAANGSGDVQGIQAESAVIQTRRTDNVQSHVDNFPLAEAAAGSMAQLDFDTSKAEADSILTPYQPRQYFLLMRVVSDSHSRFIDISEAMARLYRPRLAISCHHNPGNYAQVLPPDIQVLKIYSFDEMLGRWPDSKPEDNFDPDELDGEDELSDSEDDQESADKHNIHRPPDSNPPASSLRIAPPQGDDAEIPIVHATQILDSTLKYNSALSLSHPNLTIMGANSPCLACVQKQAMEETKKIKAHDPTAGVWVVCKGKPMGNQLI